MDYEVFLLSRVREEYLATRDNQTSIVNGIGSTGRVITSAALIMIAVFLSFVLGEDAATKMFGLGLATAIFVDATLVRMVLVPAIMTLLGDANWWFPRKVAGPADLGTRATRLGHLLPMPRTPVAPTLISGRPEGEET
jgi:RND superfamily putative drug exporter